MFDLFSWSHIVILLVVALVVVGPKDLPRLMHQAGKWAGKARAMANEFRRSFDEMARQAELDELRKEIDDLKKNNPISEIANAASDMQAEMNKTAEAAEPSPEQPVPAENPAPVEGSAEPRSGEFAVTDSAPAAAPPAP
jgi:sec-independent protein translocase protein TatB